MAREKSYKSENGVDGEGVKTDQGADCKNGVHRMLPPNEKMNDGGGQAEVASAAAGLYPRSGGRSGGEPGTQKR